MRYLMTWTVALLLGGITSADMSSTDNTPKAVGSGPFLISLDDAPPSECITAEERFAGR